MDDNKDPVGTSEPAGWPTEEAEQQELLTGSLIEAFEGLLRDTPDELRPHFLTCMMFAACNITYRLAGPEFLDGQLKQMADKANATTAHDSNGATLQ